MTDDDSDSSDSYLGTSEDVTNSLDVNKQL